jgi:hypothetical protein
MGNAAFMKGLSGNSLPAAMFASPPSIRVSSRVRDPWFLRWIR